MLLCSQHLCSSKTFITANRSSLPVKLYSSTSLPLFFGDLYPIFVSLSFLVYEPHLSGIIQSLSFCIWLISHPMFLGSSRLQHVSELHTFLWLSNISLCVSHVLFIHLSKGIFWVVSTFCLLWMMLRWTLVCKYMFGSLFWVRLGHVPGSGIAGLSDDFGCSFLRNCQTIFHSGCGAGFLHFIGNWWRSLSGRCNCTDNWPQGCWMGL